MRHWMILGFLLGGVCQLTAQSPSTAQRMDAGLQLQEAQPVRESLYLHLNTAEIWVGETLYFAIYCLQDKKPELTSLSKIAYVELINEAQEPVYQSKIKLQNGVGYGDFFIPSGFKTGAYRLIAYTRWMQNFEKEAFFQSNLLIINPFQTLPDSISIRSDSRELVQNSSSYPIQVQLDKALYQHRDLVKVNLNLAQDQRTDWANLSVSIRKKQRPFHCSPENIQNYLFQESSNAAISEKRQNNYLPELRGMLLSGTLRRPQSKEVLPNRLVYLSMPSKNYYFDVTRSNAQGKFYFNIPDSDATSELIIQTHNPNQEDLEIILDRDFAHEHHFKSLERLPLAKMDSAWIAHKAMQVQIENAYFDFKKDSVLIGRRSRFYQKPDLVYRLDEYTRFRKMEEVIREIIYTVFLRKKEDRYFVKVSKSRSDLPLDGEAFVLLDGVPIVDMNAFLNYDPLQVERVEVVGSRYFKGALDCQGIVSFETYRGDFQGLSLPPEAIRQKLIGTQPFKRYFQPHYDTAEARASRIPDYREQLYWNPYLQLTSDKPLQLEFYTSDDSGEYLMDIQGLTREGKAISYQAVFKVAEEKER